jgi:hypothetical protein
MNPVARLGGYQPYEVEEANNQLNRGNASGRNPCLIVSGPVQ